MTQGLDAMQRCSLHAQTQRLNTCWVLCPSNNPFLGGRLNFLQQVINFRVSVHVDPFAGDFAGHRPIFLQQSIILRFVLTFKGWRLEGWRPEAGGWLAAKLEPAAEHDNRQ